MKITTRVWAAGAVAAGFVGCGPPEIVPVVPPGIELARVAAPSEDDKSQAVGEAINSTNADTAKAVAAPRGPAGDEATPTEGTTPRTLASGLSYLTMKPGNGTPVRAGQRAYVHYTGTLTNGKVFDSSREKGQPLPFVVGAGKVIRGWDQGVAGMKVGERRQLTIPANLAYGDNPPSREIPPNSTLLFDVELMKVE